MRGLRAAVPKVNGEFRCAAPTERPASTVGCADQKRAMVLRQRRAEVAGDGRSNWLKGVHFLAVYLILGLAFFLIPQV